MSKGFSPLPLSHLLQLTLSGVRTGKFMGIPSSLFFRPDNRDPFCMERYGQILSTPIGVAAGPHTQLAQNIVAAWLCGARYIELKTVQTLDELEVSKPCIDMEDEGYNCEWSQELKLHESFREYLHAWIMIHILHRELKFAGTPGTLFNMSVGYNMEGILKENIQWFFSKMADCSAELVAAKEELGFYYPAIKDIDIPSCISNNITLSTMHGCPPEEIEKIGLYLIQEKRLHTTIKLNPTLLGPDELRTLLNDKLGFDTVVPDLAFEHDLKYPDALNLIRRLSEASASQGLHFAIKLTNTLESHNHRDVFGKRETMMYMSGRALHPISIRLAAKLRADLGEKPDISFSAGVDCFNIAEVLQCGLKPVTVCSDLLKPGGYGRLWQYIDILRQKAAEKNYHPDPPSAKQYLENYADIVADNVAYHKNLLTGSGIKTSRPLGFFDCIHAPCTDTCPTNQDIPEYLYQTANGRPDAAFETIFNTNPFPSVTGMVCDHLCQLKCTRINYDEALHIREVKRFVANTSPPAGCFGTPPPAPPLGGEGRIPRAAIVGAGPAGLSCAWFLNKAGLTVDVYEARPVTGGMVSAAIPSFRLTGEAIERDISRILDSGVKLRDNFAVTGDNFGAIKDEHDVVFLAAGAQKSMPLKIEGVDSEGVLDPLEFLFRVKENPACGIGMNVLIIGGGNTAMDAARTAFRLVGEEGKVTVAYRRTIHEMPADRGEIDAICKEGIAIIELVNPERILSNGGRVTSVLFSRNTLTGKGSDGRPAPVKVENSEFEIAFDTVIPAIGQVLGFDFISREEMNTDPGSYKTRIEKVYTGGDAMRGASTAINAIGDGRKAAAEMLSDLGCPPLTPSIKVVKSIGEAELMRRKSIRKYGHKPRETALDDRKNFNLVMASYSPDEAKEEASRCLYCDEICNICVTVCPNLANFSYQTEPKSFQLQKAMRREDGSLGFEEDQDFSVEQKFQVLNIRDLCNECGNCTTFCPGSGRPFADKPGLCLSIESFNREEEGYYLSVLAGKTILICKAKGVIKTLEMEGGQYIYETAQVRAVLDPETFRLREVAFKTPCVKEFRFTFAAEMRVIMEGAMQLRINN